MATLTARMVLALRFVRFSLLRANFVVARLICSYIGFPQYARLAFLEEGVGVGSLDPVAFRRRLFLLSPKKCLGKKRFSGISPPSLSVDDSGIEEIILAELVVRCLPGYPERPPKLHVASKKGLSEEQSQCLHTMLVEQGSLLTPAPAEDKSWGKSGPVAPAYGDLGESGSEDWVFFELFSQGCGESDNH